MMHVHHADRFAPLLDALAEVLAPPLADPFAPDLVAVPTVGVRDAITAGLGHRLGSTGAGDGVVANVEFVFPGGLVGRALGATPEVPGSAAGDPWELDRLVWSVLEELADGGNAGPGARPGDEWALARRLADLFDRYASQRPGMVQGWADGRATDGVVDEHGVEGVLGPAHRWQFELWRAVRERIGAPSPAERLPGLLAALRTGATRPELPDRVCAFGLASVAPALLRVLHALGAQREVHLFVRHPSRIAWDTSPHALSALAPRSQLDVTVSTTHPLLTSWARPALETRALVGGLPDVVSSACGALTAPPVTLLGVVQGAVRADTAPALAPGVDAADGTIQVHACHGAVRQLEVLRDALGHAFVHDRTLQPHDVLVLCPDLERFAPLVEPVFGRGALPVPVRVGDRSLTTEDPVAAALVAVLALAAGRCTLSELLTFLQMDPVRARFAITQADVELLTSWCEELGTKWGIEAAHRADWGLPVDVETGTWRTGLDRLMAGAALAAPTPRAALGNVAPYDDISTDGFTLAGKIADVVARLSRLHDVLHTRMGVDAWIELLHATLDEFVLTDFDSQWRVQAVHRALNDVAVAAGGSAVPLSLSDVQALLATQLDGAPGRLALRTGAVTVSSLVPLRGVPARVVCLLGFDDEALRAGTFDGDDILGLRPCVGERHPRHELRHLLLDAVLAAQERLVITCDGADITTNRKMPFAVPLAELLDVVARTVPIGESRAPVVLRHPRHGFADPALLSGALVVGGAFTFDPAMLRAAQARRAVTATDPRQNAGSRWQLPPVRCDEVTVGDLVTAVTQPARVLLVQRLEVSLPDEADAVDDNLALGITPLEASTLGRGLLGARRVGATGWEEAARLGGALPPGELATAVLDEVSDAVEAIEVRASVHGVPLAGADVVAVDQLLNVPALPGAPDVRITGDIEGFAGSCLVRVDFVRPRPSHKLTAALRLALVQRQDPARDWTAVLVTRAGSGDEALGVRLRIRGEGAEREAHAAAIVTVAVELLEWARRDAVPLFDRVSPHLAVGDLGHAEGQINQMYDDYAALLWPALDLETLRNEPIDPLDPESVRSRAPDPRAIAVAKWVWETYADHVEEFDA